MVKLKKTDKNLGSGWVGQAPTQIFFSVFLLYMEKKNYGQSNFFGIFLAKSNMAPTKGNMAPTKGNTAPTKGNMSPTKGRMPQCHVRNVWMNHWNYLMNGASQAIFLTSKVFYLVEID